MNAFNFCVPTKIYFGKNQLDSLPKAIEPYGKNILLVYGGGSIKKTGLYDKIMMLLRDYHVVEFSGVEPNPHLSTVNRGATVCRENHIDIILAVGGGSVIDCSKVIAAATLYDGDPWDYVSGKVPVSSALPVASILTLAATGSEMDSAAVITNTDTKEKICMLSPQLYPVFSILDPENTYSVSRKQTASGAADTFSHVLENYFNRPHEYLADGFSESLMRTVIKYAPIAMEKPNDYEARSELMWAATLAINGIASVGKVNAWSCHPIEHELSAYYDIPHGLGLALITPKWMRYILNEDTVDFFKRYAVNVWGLNEELDPFELAEQAIVKTEVFFFKTLGLPMQFSDIGIDDKNFDVMSRHAAACGLNAAFQPLTEEDVRAIFTACL